MVEGHDDELAERRAGGRARAAGALPHEFGDEPSAGEGPGSTIDLTERAARDDFAAWTGVLRRRPAEAARLSSHPSAAGERATLAAPQLEHDDDEDEEEDDDAEFSRIALDRRRRRGRNRSGNDEEGGSVSRLRPVGGEPDEPVPPRGVRSDVASRVATATAMAAGGLLTLNAGTAATAFLCALIVAFGILELTTALRAQGHRPAVLVALLGGIGLVIGAYNSGQSAFPAVGALVLAGSALWYLAGVGGGRPATGLATTLLVFAYVGGLGGFGGLILAFPNGIGLILGVVLCTAAHDIFGFAAGRRFGRHPLTALSPNKTVEGLAVGMIGAMVIGVVLVGGITPWDRLSGLALGALVAVCAPVGDLCESMLKRDLGVKDLGGILPGHGGVLDRFDGILFSLPAVYYLVRLLELA